MSDKPKINYAIATARFRSELHTYIESLRNKYPIPNYLIEGIMSGELSEVRGRVINDTTDELYLYEHELEAFYESRKE